MNTGVNPQFVYPSSAINKKTHFHPVINKHMLLILEIVLTVSDFGVGKLTTDFLATAAIVMVYS